MIRAQSGVPGGLSLFQFNNLLPELMLYGKITARKE